MKCSTSSRRVGNSIFIRKMNSHGISSPDTMASKGRVGDSPLSSKSGINDHFGGVEKNGTFITERVEEYNPEPWQDNRSTFRKLKDWWLFEVLGCLLSIGASCGMYKYLCITVRVLTHKLAGYPCNRTV